MTTNATRTYKANDYRNKFIKGKYREGLFYTLVILVALLIASCSDKSKSYKPSPSDTTRFSGIFTDESDNQRLRLDYIWLTTKDSMKVDTISRKVVMARDSTWFIPIAVPQMDSTKKQKVDSVGNKLFKWVFVPTDRKNIVQYWRVGK
jgi:hypothetical protein